MKSRLFLHVIKLNDRKIKTDLNVYNHNRKCLLLRGNFSHSICVKSFGVFKKRVPESSLTKSQKYCRHRLCGFRRAKSLHGFLQKLVTSLVSASFDKGQEENGKRVAFLHDTVKSLSLKDVK